MNPFDISANEYLSLYTFILDEMICKMTTAELGNSISYNFIVQMLPHHQAAIEMSRNVLQYTNNCTLQNIASNIIEEQTKSIEDMCDILNTCEMCENSGHDLYTYQRTINNIKQTMFCRMKNACATNRINCNFMWEMIPHHEGAVQMSATTLRYCICPQLRPILQAIISSQRKGIMQMKCLLKQIHC